MYPSLMCVNNSKKENFVDTTLCRFCGREHMTGQSALKTPYCDLGEKSMSLLHYLDEDRVVSCRVSRFM